MPTPKLAAFPKLHMQALCKTGAVTISEWIDAAATHLDVDGLEWYSGFLEMQDESNWDKFRQQVEAHGMSIPMLRCSPDFTHPDLEVRAKQVRQQKDWIRMCASLGGSYCRVLSGQKRPHLSREEGVIYTVECIKACLPFAADHGVTLIMENHYKDEFWKYTDFAQSTNIFCDIVERIDHPNFSISYDPSNALLAGEAPLELLGRVSRRVVTMHASDCYLAEGTSDDLRRDATGSEDYAARLHHGEVGKGLNDYDAIFTELKCAGFGSASGDKLNWISIEDGVDGIEQLMRSADFLKAKIAEYW